MKDFDWIAARCECSPNLVFEKLKAQVEKDVESREKTLTAAQKVRFRFEFTAGHTDFSVIVSGNNIHGSIAFVLTETGIIVLNEERKSIFSADVTISDEGECKLRVSGEEKELWQVRKMALEALLFGKY